MAIRDIEAFMRERAQAYDGNMDVTPGSPYDVQVIQPLLRRLGTDPFTVDLTTFIADRMAQAFPDIANQDDDAITDLLNKPATLLWDPIVREIGRVRKNLSFADPTQMTVEEADALGANYFSTRKQGQFSKGPGRILFQNPQNISISPANFFTSKGGLHFFPTETQSIRLEEMLLNVTTDGLYYFDVNTIAEAAGSTYNIEPDSLISIANVPSATRVTNVRRFTMGEQEESAQGFVSRAKQELSERSLVTLRGIAAKLVGNFPEVTRLNVAGVNDPEMQRDVIKGGGLGVVRAHGVSGQVLADGEGAATSRRFYAAGAGFLSIFGMSGEVSGWTLTAFEAFGSSADLAELTVSRVVDANTLEVAEQVLVVGTLGVRWTLRKKELTLSDIPGGLLFPNSPDGTTTIPDDEVHIGGMYDTYIRGSALDEEVFVVDNITDDEPMLSGVGAVVTMVGAVRGIALPELGLAPFSAELIAQLDEAVRFGYTLQVQDGPNAGSYRIIGHGLTGASELFLEVFTTTLLIVEPTPRRWRLFDVINIDLLNPRETRVTGTDLTTLQNSDVVSVPAGTDFMALGVSEGDALEVMAGPLAGVYTVLETPTLPTSVRLDKVLDHTLANLSYRIYRPNTGGALSPPFVRVTKVELLDSSRQPVGTEIPYARPVDVQTRAFQNPSRGVKHDLRNVRLGLVTLAAAPTFGYSAGQTLTVYVEGASPAERTLTLSETAPTVDDALADLNAQFLSIFGLPQVVTKLGTDRLGIRPVGAGGYVAVTGGTALSSLFGPAELYTTGDVRSDDVSSWEGLSPPIDFLLGLDVLQVLDGVSVGFYASPFTASYVNMALFPAASVPSSALLIGALVSNDPTSYLPRVTFAPEHRRRVQVGARSLGSARVYFLSPTSFEVDANAVFALETDTGGLRFIPDPNLDHQRIPPLPGNATPQDGSATSAGSSWTSSSQDFVLAGLLAGDKLVVENIPVEGTVVVPDPIPALVGTSFVFSLDGGEDRSLIFIRDDVSLGLTEVSQAGAIDQLNAAFGEDIASLTGAGTIRLSTTRALAVRSSGTANGLLLGTVAGTTPALDFTAEDVSNESPFAGTYLLASVLQHELTITGVFPSAAPYSATVTEQSFRVLRTGVQRISVTEMAENEASAGLYYFDVELVSEGTGDQYNIDSGLQLRPSGYRSDGYYITTDDQNLTFSVSERPKLVISRTVLERGVDDSPVNATQLTGENIQVTYQRSQLVSDIQNYLSAETERVVCANPLSRHLIPMFVRLDLVYQGGSGEAVVLEDVTSYVTDLAPTDTLDASDVQKLVADRGASYVQNPLDLVGVVYGIDRSVWVSRSQDQLTAGRLTSFIPEQLSVTRRVT